MTIVFILFYFVLCFPGGNIFCVKLWGRKNAPYLQTLHFAFALGAFLAPMLARPFLSNENLFSNTTLLKNERNTSLSKTRSVRSDLYNEKLYYLFNDFEGIDGFLSKNEEEFRYKRDSGPVDTAEDTTPSHSTSKTSSLKTPVTTKHVSSIQTAVPSDVKVNTVTAHNQNTSSSGDVSNGIKVNRSGIVMTKTPTTSVVVSNGTKNGTNVTVSGIVATKTPTTSKPLTTTLKITKPKAASDTHLKEHTADAKQMSDMKQASEPIEPPGDKHTESADKATTKTSPKVTETPNINMSQSNPALSNNGTGNQLSQTGSQTMKPSTTTGLVDGNRDLKNESAALGPGMVRIHCLVFRL